MCNAYLCAIIIDGDLCALLPVSSSISLIHNQYFKIRKKKYIFALIIYKHCKVRLISIPCLRLNSSAFAFRLEMQLEIIFSETCLFIHFTNFCKYKFIRQTLIFSHSIFKLSEKMEDFDGVRI